MRWLDYEYTYHWQILKTTNKSSNCENYYRCQYNSKDITTQSICLFHAMMQKFPVTNAPDVYKQEEMAWIYHITHQVK
jgi:hypothetical protein